MQISPITPEIEKIRTEHGDFVHITFMVVEHIMSGVLFWNTHTLEMHSLN